MGQPHNIIRHPDMPPEAFDNLWDTLQGRQAVARRGEEPPQERRFLLGAGDGLSDPGERPGYRLYLDPHQAAGRPAQAAAEEVYAAIREKKPHGYRVDAGIIRRRSLLDHFAIFTRTLKARLVTHDGAPVAVRARAWHRRSAARPAVTTSLSLALLAVAGAAVLGFAGLTTMRAIQGPMQQLNDTLVNLVQDKLDNRIADPA